MRGTEARSRITLRGRAIADGRVQMHDTLDYRVFWKQVNGDWLISRLYPVE